MVVGALDAQFADDARHTGAEGVQHDAAVHRRRVAARGVVLLHGRQSQHLVALPDVSTTIGGKVRVQSWVAGSLGVQCWVMGAVGGSLGGESSHATRESARARRECSLLRRVRGDQSPCIPSSSHTVTDPGSEHCAL
jgi:hypothetical protein